MAIEDWTGILVEKLAEIEGVEAVYSFEELPGTLLTFPCMVVMPLSGGQEYSASGPAVSLVEMQVTLYTAAQVLPEAQGTAVPFIKKVRDKMAENVTLGGAVSYILPPPVDEAWFQGPGAVRYGDKEHVGIIFKYRVKEVEVVTVNA